VVKILRQFGTFIISTVKDMTKKERAEENYRKKFDEFGLSDRFEFIRREWSADHDRRFWSRCKTCGAEFLSYNEVFRGRQKHLICPQCGTTSDGGVIWERSPSCDDAMAFYVQGHSVRETAERFGVTKEQINNSVKVRGLTNGRMFKPDASDASRLIEYSKKAQEETKERLINRLDSLGFEYLGGYEDGRVKIQCKACKDVFERTSDFAKRGKVICRKCEHERTLIHQEERRKRQKIDSAKKQEKKKAEKLAKNPLGLSDYQLSRMALLDDVHVCKVCGKEYTLRQYIESVKSKYYRDSGYCSAECRHKANSRNVHKSRKRRHVPENHRQRARVNGCAYDASVTLPKLIKRNGLRCAICGEMCNLNDHTWNQYMGPMSPTIDHIIPMAKGGGHTWDNVQIAHAICNSYKSDSIEEGT